MKSRSRVFDILVGAIIMLFVASLYAGVAMPSFRKGQQSACSSNIHQLALALQIYSSDYDSVLPPIPYRKEDSWPRALRSYALSDQARKHGKEMQDISTIKPYICPARADMGYGFAMNYSLAGGMIDGDVDPTVVILLAEAKEVTDEDWWVFDFEQQVVAMNRCLPASRIPLYSSHPSGANIAFLDGHVSAKKQGQLSAENWHAY